jgi:pyruvate,water dikinase
MIPFCRTVEEGKRVLALMKKYGLEREPKISATGKPAAGGESGKLKVFVMCEIPSNVILADRFLDIFDGMSIGSNDLTQLALGIDRDGNERIRSIANENNAAVRQLLAQVIHVCRKRKKYVGICGQGPSDFPDLAAFLVREGIESMSLNPDSVISTILALSRLKKARRARRA